MKHRQVMMLCSHTKEIRQKIPTNVNSLRELLGIAQYLETIIELLMVHYN